MALCSVPTCSSVAPLRTPDFPTLRIQCLNKRECQIRILAHYLDGKAYHFYMQKVASDDPNNWNLHKFFTELFNFCFPVDYRQQMRVKLENFNQKKGQTVSEFVFELQELFSMVGAMPENMKVVKLWYSLSKRTQRAMWIWLTSGLIHLGRGRGQSRGD